MLELIRFLLSKKINNIFVNKLGITYSAFASLDIHADEGSSSFVIRVPQDLKGKSHELLVRFLNNIVREGFSQQEILLAKLFLLNRHKRSLERLNMMNYDEIPSAEDDGHNIDHIQPEDDYSVYTDPRIALDYESFYEKVRSIKEDEVNSLLKTLVKPDNLVTVLSV